MGGLGIGIAGSYLAAERRDADNLGHLNWGRPAKRKRVSLTIGLRKTDEEKRPGLGGVMLIETRAE
jgi:hypothetical protein